MSDHLVSPAEKELEIEFCIPKIEIMTHKNLRIAFVTNEFISEKKSGGGLGNYLNRITQALKDIGHVPEVFVISNSQPSIIDFRGIRVERVPPLYNLALKLISRVTKKLKITKGAPWGGPEGYLACALALSRALEKRHAQQPFDFIQSTNCNASGLLIRHLPKRLHLIRLSSKRDLWFQVDGRYGFGTRLMSYLERECVRRADIAYAPSQFLAECCYGDWRDDVQVIRPPVFIETKSSNELLPYLPNRYLIHFGQIGRRKGSDVLAAALCRVWQKEPTLKMVWAGKPIKEGEFERCHQLWGEFSTNVIWLGSLEKARLYNILQKAEAAVLPSRIDNLPNTVIESLMFGVPVIGPKGASIDELVEPGVSGELVEISDDKTLAEIILKVWRREVDWIKDGFQQPHILKELEPHQAAKNLIKLAGFDI